MLLKLDDSLLLTGGGRYYNMLFGPLAMTAAVVDTAVAYAAMIVYKMDISKIDIVVLYSLSI